MDIPGGGGRNDGPASERRHHDDGDEDFSQLAGTTPPPREAFKKRKSMTRMESYLGSNGSGGTTEDDGGRRRADSDGDVNVFLTADELLRLADADEHMIHDYDDDDDDDDDDEGYDDLDLDDGDGDDDDDDHDDDGDPQFHMDDEGYGKSRDVPETAIAAGGEWERRGAKAATGPRAGEGGEDGDPYHHAEDFRHPIGGGDDDDYDDYVAPAATAAGREDAEVRAAYPALRRRFFPTRAPSPDGGAGDDDGDVDGDPSSVDVVPPCLVETCFAALVLLASPRCSSSSRDYTGENRHRPTVSRIDAAAVHLLLPEIVGRYRRYEHLGHDEHEHDGKKPDGGPMEGSTSIELEVEGVIRTLRDGVPLIDIDIDIAAEGEWYEVALHPDVMGGDGDGRMDRFAAWLLVGRRADGDDDEAVAEGGGGCDDPSARHFWSHLVSSVTTSSSHGGTIAPVPADEVREASRVIHAILAVECLRVLGEEEGDKAVDVGGELSSALCRHLLDRIGLDDDDSGFGAGSIILAAERAVAIPSTPPNEERSSPSPRRYALLNVVRHAAGTGDVLLKTTATPGEVLRRTLGSDALLLRRLLLLPPPSTQPPPPPDRGIDAPPSPPSPVSTTSPDADFERRVLHNWKGVIADAELWYKWAYETKVICSDSRKHIINPDRRLLGLYRGWAERCYGMHIREVGPTPRPGCSYSSGHVGRVLLLLGRSVGRVVRGGNRKLGAAGAEELLYYRESLKFQTRSVLSSSLAGRGLAQFDVTRIASARVVDHRRWRRQKREAAAAAAAAARAPESVLGRSVVVFAERDGGDDENDVGDTDTDSFSAWRDDGAIVGGDPPATLIDVVDSRGRRLQLPVPVPVPVPHSLTHGVTTTTKESGATPPPSAAASGAAAVLAAVDLSVLGETLHDVGCALLSSTTAGTNDEGEKKCVENEEDREDPHEIAVRYLNGARQLLRLFLLDDDVELRSGSDLSLTSGGGRGGGGCDPGDELDRKHHGGAVTLGSGGGGGSIASSSSYDVPDSPMLGSLLDRDAYRRVCTVLGSVEVHLGTVHYTRHRKFHEALAHFTRALRYYDMIGICATGAEDSCSSRAAQLSSPRSTANFRDGGRPSPPSSRASSSLICQMLASLKDGEGGEYDRADLLRRIRLHVAQRHREHRRRRRSVATAATDDVSVASGGAVDDDESLADADADADAWDELSSLYSWMGSTHREMGHHESALECFVESVVCANASSAAAAAAPAPGTAASSSPRSGGTSAAADDDGDRAETCRNHGGAMARGFFNMAVTLDDMGIYDQSVRFYNEAWSYYWDLWQRGTNRHRRHHRGGQGKTPPSFPRRRSSRRGDDYRLFADMLECVLCMGNVMMVRSNRGAALGYYMEGLILFLAEWCNLSSSAIVASSQPRLRHLQTRGHNVLGIGTSEQRQPHRCEEVKLMVDDDGHRLHCLTRFLVSDDFNLWNMKEELHAAFTTSAGDVDATKSTDDDVAHGCNDGGSNELDEEKQGSKDSVDVLRDHNEADEDDALSDTIIMETTADSSSADIDEAEEVEEYGHLHSCLRERLQRLFAAARDHLLRDGRKGSDSKSRPSKRHPVLSTFSREDCWRIMSDVAFYLNDTESAVEYCRRSLDDGDDESPISLWSLYRLGVHHIRLQDYSAAASKLGSFLECCSDNDDYRTNSRQYGDALYHLGYCHAQLGDRTESRRCYQRSLHLLTSHREQQTTHEAETDERRQRAAGYFDLVCANIWQEMACLSLSCDCSDGVSASTTLSPDPLSTDETLGYFIQSIDMYQLHGHMDKHQLPLAFSLKHLAMMYRLMLQGDEGLGDNENKATLMKNEAHDLLCMAMVIWQKARATEKLHVNVDREDKKKRDDSGEVPRCPSTTELEIADIFYELGLLSLASPSLETTGNDADQNNSGANEGDDGKEGEQNFKRALYAYLHYYQYNLTASSSANNDGKSGSSHAGNPTSIRNSIKLAKIYHQLSRTTRSNVKSGNDEACGSRSLLYLQNAKNIMTNINASASAPAIASSSSTVPSWPTAAALASRDQKDLDMDEPQLRRLEFEAELCHDLGTEYVFLQRHSNALDCLTRSLELRRGIGESLKSLGKGVLGYGDDEILRNNTEQRGGTSAEQSVVAEAGLRHDNVVSNAVKMARTCNNIGIIHAKVGRYNVAMSYLQEALLFTSKLPKEASGDLDSTAIVLLSPSGSGGLSSAIPTTEAKEERSNTLFSMGHVHAKTLDFEEALECFEASLSILRAIEAEKKDTHGFILSNLLHSLGRTHAKLHQWTEAKLCYQESVEIRRLGMRDKKKRANDCSGPLHETPHSARENDISREVDDHWVMTDDEDDDIDGPLRLSHSLHHLGIAHEHLGDYQNAMMCYEEAWFLRKLHLTRDHVIMAQSLLRMGNVKVQDGCHYEVALKLYQEALRVQRLNLGEDHLSVAETHYRMGMVRHVRGEWTQARECYKKALGVYGSNGENQCHSSYDEDVTGTTMADIMNAWKEVKVYEKECIDSEDAGLVHDWSKLSVDPKGCSEKMEEMLQGLLELVDQCIVTPGCEMAQQNISKAVSSIQGYYSRTTSPTVTSLPMAEEGRRTTPSDSRVYGVAQQMGSIED